LLDLEVARMNVREVVEIVLAQNGGRKIEPTCDQLIEGDWEGEVISIKSTGYPSRILTWK
jgi:hypothetical protein